MRVRPMRNWCLVLVDERQERVASGRIVLPTFTTNPEKLTEGTGRLLAVGTSPRTHALGLEGGQRVAYRSYLKHSNPVPTEDAWPSGAPKESFLMSCDDIMGVVQEGVEIGVFSSPASHAVGADAFEKLNQGEQS